MKAMSRSHLTYMQYGWDKMSEYFELAARNGVVVEVAPSIPGIRIYNVVPLTIFQVEVDFRPILVHIEGAKADGLKILGCLARMPFRYAGTELTW
jgi:hypothetical protein